MQIEHFLQASRRLLVITGAGCSVPSGIGDYRDERGQWKRKQPVQHQQFMRSLSWRQRYWARSQAGYPSFMSAKPNGAHRVLAGWQDTGRLVGLVTQNVDRLHQRAGHRQVVDLHGRLDQVVCMGCAKIVDRSALQTWLDLRNEPPSETAFELGADGDAQLQEHDYSNVAVPNCDACGGILKPNVVFFGDSVPRDVVQQIYAQVERAGSVLVVGSSLMVYSSFRFVRHAAKNDIPIAAINRGHTRADDMLSVKLEEDCEQALRSLEESLK